MWKYQTKSPKTGVRTDGQNYYVGADNRRSAGKASFDLQV